MLVVLGEDVVVVADPQLRPRHGADAVDQTRIVLLGTEHSGLSHNHDHSSPSHTTHSVNHQPVVVLGPAQRMASQTEDNCLVVH